MTWESLPWAAWGGTHPGEPRFPVSPRPFWHDSGTTRGPRLGPLLTAVGAGKGCVRLTRVMRRQSDVLQTTAVRPASAYATTSRSASADGAGVGAEHPEEELDDDGSGRGPDVGSIPSLIDSVNDQLTTTSTSQPPISHRFVCLLNTPPTRSPHGERPVCHPHAVEPQFGRSRMWMAPELATP